MHPATEPLVSCIMPTYNRRRFVPYAIRYFLRQDYGNKELIVIDDGTDPIQDLIPDEVAVRYIRLYNKITLGAKLNLACREAAGNIIVHWDDDDWYSPGRLRYQVGTLLQEKKDLCGINRLLYYDLRNGNAYQYIYPPGQRVWLLGSSLCYTRELWNKNQFADIDVGMDGLFVWATAPERIKVLSDPSFSVHMIHSSNVSPKKTEEGWWHPYPQEEIRKITGNDWKYYQHEELPATDIKINRSAVPDSHVQTGYSTIKNIYACLVHEHEDCVIDLVRNLHHHDPASVVLLYNGGEQPALMGNRFPYHKYGAVIHPGPKPMKHGYLHNFALECMQFALDNFSFDTLTIVDSDQLAIRAGYTGYLGKFLSSRSGAGMLSSNPERVNRHSTSNYVALQAFRELDLWQPLLNRYPNGESRFVHWTFWPSTVFTSNAARDLVKLFRENRILQDIMQRTRIWASEEVVLPTLTRLLGYEIVLNPCSYDFVQYRKAFTVQDIAAAYDKPAVYWVHPVPRQYDDPVRSYIRQRSNGYEAENKSETSRGIASFHTFGPALLEKIRAIQGWLSDQEANLLMTTVLKAGEGGASPYTIVEIGSYHGKSTVLFGSMLQTFFPGARLVAIDPHDGLLGAADQGLQSFPPSFDVFKKNLCHAGLSGMVEIIKDQPGNVQWEGPISLLFIDGLHDYLNVSKDFQHFAAWVRPGGYIAFHDYADYFPGVKRFVHELLRTGKYRKTDHTETLIVLEKL